MDAQIWAGVNTMNGVVEIFVNWKRPPKPDLSVSNIRVDARTNPNNLNFQVGETVSINCNVWNVGGTPANTSRVGFYIKSSENNTDGTPFATGSVPVLNSNSFSPQQTFYTFTSNDVGSRYFVFEADHLNQIDESNKSNNVRSFGPFQVISPPNLDLSPLSYNFGNAEVFTEGNETEFTLSNNGATSVTGNIALRFNEHFKITSGGGSFNLTPGNSKTIRVEFQPNTTGSKTDFLRVFINGVTSHFTQSTLNGNSLTPPETIVGYSDIFTFDTRNIYSGGIFLKVIETDPDKNIVSKVGYRRNNLAGLITTESDNKYAMFDVDEEGTAFMTLPEYFDPGVFDINQIVLFNNNDEQIGHIDYSYSLKWEGMNTRHAIIFLHNDGEFFGGDKNDESRYFPYHKNSPSNPPGQTYNYYNTGEYPVSMLIPPHCNSCEPGGYRFPAQYDGKPVLFVHGLTGTFSHQDEAVQSQTSTKGDQVSYWFDTERKLNEMGPYHAWQFYYPNEDDLMHCGLMLGQTVEYLTSRYNQPLNFVAHSMGGLVTMEYLTTEGNYDSEKIGKVLLSMSPIHGSLGGNRNYRTNLGWWAQFVGQDGKAPAYRDLSIGSNFLHALHNREWPLELVENSIVVIGLTSKKYKLPELLHQEASEHSDGIVSFSSASLISKGIGLIGYYGNHDDGRYSKTLQNKSLLSGIIDAYIDDSKSFLNYSINEGAIELFINGEGEIIIGDGVNLNSLYSHRTDVNFQKGLTTLNLDEDYNDVLTLYAFEKLNPNREFLIYVLSSRNLKSPDSRYEYNKIGQFIKNKHSDFKNYYFTKTELTVSKEKISLFSLIAATIIGQQDFKYYGDVGFDIKDETYPLWITDDNDPYGYSSLFGFIEPKPLQHQFVHRSLLKSQRIKPSQQTPTKSLLVTPNNLNPTAEINVDNQTSYIEFLLFNDVLIFEGIDYAISLINPDGIALGMNSDGLSYNKNPHTGLSSISITNPIPGKWKVIPIIDITSVSEQRNIQFNTKANIESDIQLMSDINLMEFDLNQSIDLVCQLNVPEINLLDISKINAYIEIQHADNADSSPQMIVLNDAAKTGNTVQYLNSFNPDTTGNYFFSIIFTGVYDSFHFERALHGSFTVTNTTSQIAIPNQELNIYNRFVELPLPYYYYPAPGFENVSYEVWLDSITFNDDEYLFHYDPDNNVITLFVEEDAPMASAWLKVNCFDTTDSLVASTNFRIRYTAPGVPDLLSVVDLTASSARLNWVPRDTESIWDIIYGPPGFNPQTEGTLIENVSSYPHLIDNFSTGSSHEFYVRAVFEDIKGAWSWPANFTTNHTIYSQASGNGSISPNGEIEVSHLGFRTYNIVPDNHYHVSDVMVNGKSIGAVTSYTFDFVSGSHTIEAEFSINTYTINARVNELEGGRIIGAGNYEYGREVTLEAIAEDGYQFQYWVENDTQVSDNPVISFTSESNRTLTAWFTPITGLPGKSLNIIEVFPNPFNEIITIKNAGQIKQVTLVTPLGQVVLIRKLTGSYLETVPTLNLPVGLYLLKIEDRDGFQTVRKLIKN
ncbi:InlB B-repeat-containing protein [Geofilum rubicundum]|uniref:Fibronectin type-III domain-containing protein n=1 Tax=Geofilum rubicundum JCM 15548 TaxID=1236989 RepID=A0A0E9M227_9BACT|nr:T9SS type A sorting domain-containing protein [Geofilum rubicundum]GAO31648.1 hypothetical protein JCM15548_14035 [Geofilum rubicundum JCM 15548]